ncbi:hypothetical protein BT96DRAFT_944518 [Gymnopus androsaceus JB14]|uniref:Uncharacterized protein n=1 Tax=Gymnopus androsaceus JB14 TaxID=1447944 RepID=A0A6A4H618_9AGAR|nr:hypothetical protein BT96DRAFT_944518 [Gymnopus androsaceus JB14]
MTILTDFMHRKLTRMIYFDTLHHGDYAPINDSLVLIASPFSHPNVAKLFGTTHWGSPALILQSDLIPYSHFYEQCRSPIARSYLEYRLKQENDTEQARIHLSDAHYYDREASHRDAWIHPAGHICLGPPAQMQHRKNFCIRGWLRAGKRIPVLRNGRARSSVDDIDFFRSEFRCVITASTLDEESICAAWLAQAGHVLHHLDLKDAGDEYGSTPNLSRMLASFTTNHRSYLFIEPIKITKVDGISHFSLQNTAFFWSFDTYGSTQMKEETRILLGLPSFRADVGMGRGFTEDCYIVASEYLKAKGFDPFSLEYACSQGFPLFKTYGSVDSGETEHTQSVPSSVDAYTESDSESESDITYESPLDGEWISRVSGARGRVI